MFFNFIRLNLQVMRKIFILLTIIFLCNIPHLFQAQNALLPIEAKEGWILLFNGENLDGWRGYNMTGLPKGWHVEDGCLVTSSTGGSELSGDIITIDEYEDFDLSLEWAISPGGNSGIFFPCPGRQRLPRSL